MVRLERAEEDIKTCKKDIQDVVGKCSNQELRIAANENMAKNLKDSVDKIEKTVDSLERIVNDNNLQINKISDNVTRMDAIMSKINWLIVGAVITSLVTLGMNASRLLTLIK